MTASQKTFIERAGDSTIRVGQILVSAKALPDALARYSRLVFCLNDSDEQSGRERSFNRDDADR
jgi:hypothetical protein